MGTEGIDRLVVALGQIKAKGRLMGDELLQLTEAGIPATEILAQKLHLTADQVQNIGQQGIDANTAIQALLQGMNERFGGMAAKLANTLHGLLSTIKDDTKNICAFLIFPLFQSLEKGLAQVRNMTNSLSSAINGQGNIDENSGILAVIVKIQTGIAMAKDEFVKFTELFGSYDANGNFNLSDDTLSGLKKAGDLIEAAYGFALDVGDALINIIPIVVAIAERIGDWIKALIYVADFIADVVNSAIGDTKKGFSETKDVIGKVVDAIVGMYVLEKVIALVGALRAGFVLVKDAVIAVQTAIKEATIAQAIFNSLSGPAGWGKLAVGAVAGVAAGYAINKAFESIPQGDSNTNFDKEAENNLKKYFEKFRKDASNRLPYPTSTTSSPSPASASLASANKNAAKEFIKASQEAMRTSVQYLKDHLADQLDYFKDKMDEISTVYEQNGMSISEYYNAKSKNEQDQMQAHIDEIKAEISVVQNTAYDNDAEKQRELYKLNRELSKYTNQLSKAVASQKEIAQIQAEAQATQERIRAYETSGGQGNAASEKYTLKMASIADQLEKVGAQYGVNAKYVQDIMKYSTQEGIDPRLAMAVMIAESGGRQSARSGAGAIGLMQLMPDTASSLGVDPYDAEQNIMGGIKYLGELLRDFNGSTRSAIAAYNAGQGAVEKYGGVPPYAETQNYVQKVTGLMYDKDKMGLIPDARQYMDAYLEEKKRLISQQAAGSIQQLSAAVEQGVDAGFKAWEGQTMDNQRNGCVEAVTKIGSYYSTFLADAFKKGILNVPRLESYAKQFGIPEIPYDESKLKPGDAIVYGDHDHVLIYKGQGKTVGNSSSALDYIYGKGRGPGKVIEQGIDIGMTPTSIIQSGKYGVAKSIIDSIHNSIGNFSIDTIAKTKLGAEEKKAFSELLKRGVGIDKEFAELSMGGAEEEVIQATMKMRQRIQQAMANGDQRAADELRVILKSQILDIDTKYAKQSIDMQLKNLQETGRQMSYRISLGLYNAKEAVDKYFGYIFDGIDDITNVVGNAKRPQSIGAEIGRLESIMAKYQTMGNLKGYWAANDEVQKVYSALQSRMKEFVQRVDDRASFQSNMVDANSHMTNLQKEKAKKLISEQKAANELEIQEAELAYLKKIVAEENKRLEKEKEIMKTAKKGSQEYQNAASYAAIISNNINNIKYTWMPDLQNAIQLNKELANQADLLNKIRQAAKQSLEDGLVSYLSDGINQAKSLGDAFRGLATSILQSMQKIFAQNIVEGLMTKWFGGGQSSIQLPQPQAHATGGIIKGSGTDTSDNIPSWLSPGEFVVKAASVRKYGLRTLERINNGTFTNLRVNIPRFASGGIVGDTPNVAAGAIGNMVTAIVDGGKAPVVNTTVTNVVDSKQLENFITTTVVKNSKLYTAINRHRG